MAVKSVFEVDVRTGAFNAFTAAYDKYQKHLKLAPAEWKKVTDQIGKGRAEFDKLVNQEVAQIARQRLRLAAAREAERLTSSEARSWKSIASSSKEFTVNIGRATTQLLRWGGLTTVVSGLIGAGGLFGIDRMAAGVSAQRRSALGIGAGYGAQASFNANFGRLVDPSSFLSSVAESKLDVSKRTGLLGAGLSERQIGGDTASVSVALLRRLKTIADETNPQLYGQTINARQLGGFVGPQDLQRLRNTSREEFEQLIRNYSGGKGRFGLDDDTTRKWQDFTTQMGAAGTVIETVLVKGLTPLAPALTKLSDSVATTIESFLANPKLKDWIDGVGTSLKNFSEYVLTPEFQTGVKQFADGIIVIGHRVATVAKWFAPRSPTPVAPWTTMRNEQMARDRAEGKASGWIQFNNPFSWKASNGEPPPALMSLVRRLENSGDAAVSPAGAIGRYQIMPGTARQYGFDPSRLTDSAYNEQAAKAVLADLIKRYKGDTDQILAAYNGGPGRGNRLRDTGSTSGLPLETQNYINRAHGMQGYSPRVTIDVNNNTGGAVNVNTSQLPQ